MAVILEDAGGNRVWIREPVEKTIDNERGAVNGANGGDGARLRLSGRRRRTTSFARRRIVLRGRLERGGAPVRDAERGKVVEIQAFDAGSWRTFTTVRTDRRGGFRVRYRFRRTGAPRVFRFRARARFERGWPYILGVSRSVRVRVG